MSSAGASTADVGGSGCWPGKEVPVEVECGFDEDGRRFRHRAAAVILHASRVLMARNDSEPYF